MKTSWILWCRKEIYKSSLFSVSCVFFTTLVITYSKIFVFSLLWDSCWVWVCCISCMSIVSCISDWRVMYCDCTLKHRITALENDTVYTNLSVTCRYNVYNTWTTLKRSNALLYVVQKYKIELWQCIIGLRRGLTLTSIKRTTWKHRETQLR